jgi:hypothetical protein
VTAICQLLGCLFAFVVLAPSAPVHYDYQPPASVRSSR